MKVLIILENSPRRRYLVHLHTEGLVNDFKALLHEKKRDIAIMMAFAVGKLIKEVTEEESHNTDADLTLTKSGVYWDLL